MITMSNERVMIVEDESIISLDIEDMLHDLDYSVVAVAQTGEDAIKNALELMPDIILMDIMLDGDMDGIEAAERIKKEKDIPIIFVTANSDIVTLERAKITSPYAYILKPIEQRELHTNIEIAIYKHKAEKQRQQLKKDFAESLGYLQNLTNYVVAPNGNKPTSDFLEQVQAFIVKYEAVN